jgi:hypothetical protein
MIRRFLTRLRNRDGQALIVAAIVFPLVLLFLAFVVDVAHAFVNQKHLQNTADAAALAAAQEIPGPGCTGSPACLNPVVTSYVSTYNDGPPNAGQPCDASATPPVTTNCYVYPYVDLPTCPAPNPATGDLGCVLVNLKECSNTFFGGLIGVSQFCPSVRSVAHVGTSPIIQVTSTPATTILGTTIFTPVTETTVVNGNPVAFTTTTPVTILGTTNPGSATSTVVPTSFGTTIQSSLGNNALFASDMTCSPTTGIVFGDPSHGSPGNNEVIDGTIHSNGSIYLGSQPGNNITAASYGQTTPAACLPTGSGYGTTFVDPSYNTPPLPVKWPVDWGDPSAICAGASYRGTPPKSGGIPTLSGSYAGGTWCNLAPGGEIIACDPPTSGHLTVVATQIVIPNTCNRRTWPDGDYQHTFSNGTFGLLFYATGATGNDLDMQSNNDVFPQDAFGFLFAPNGEIVLDKNNGANGFWEAKDINIQFNNFTMKGFGPGSVGPSTTTTFSTTVTVGVTIPGTTVGDQTVQSTSTGSMPGASTTITNTTTAIYSTPDSVVNASTQTTTNGVSTDLRLKQ